MVCQSESMSTDSSECSFSEGGDYDNGVYLFENVLPNYVEGHGHLNLNCQLLENIHLSSFNGDIISADCVLNSELMPADAEIILDVSKELVPEPNLKGIDKGMCWTDGDFVGEKLLERASGVQRSDDMSSPTQFACQDGPNTHSCAANSFPEANPMPRTECAVSPIISERNFSPCEDPGAVRLDAAGPCEDVVGAVRPCEDVDAVRLDAAGPCEDVVGAVRPCDDVDAVRLDAAGPCEDVIGAVRPCVDAGAVRPDEGEASPNAVEETVHSSQAVDVARPISFEGAVLPSICSPLDDAIKVDSQQMQGPNYSPVQRCDLAVQVEDSQLCEVPIVLEGEIEGSEILTQLDVGGGKKRGRGRPRKRVHAKAKVSTLQLKELPDDVLLEEDPQLVASKVWHIGQKLGVTLAGESVDMVQQLTEMEERDRKAIDRIRNERGT
ncbi:Retrovirus-related Pol polyprotein from transposon TNT 1-94 [Sesbania bispinosa]|nr:Retrovirus-related Pol polyprotein from transposon TNT 1-94 [Sesbania bispinosa]